MDILEDMRNQRAVYWAPLPADENSQKQYDDPVEVIVRWEDVSQMFLDRAGNTQSSRSVIYLGCDVIELGVLWLSSKTIEDSEGSGLAELDDEVDPYNNDGAFEIRKFQKIPTIEADDFLRQAFL